MHDYYEEDMDDSADYRPGGTGGGGVKKSRKSPKPPGALKSKAPATESRSPEKAATPSKSPAKPHSFTKIKSLAKVKTPALQPPKSQAAKPVSQPKVKAQVPIAAESGRPVREKKTPKRLMDTVEGDSMSDADSEISHTTSSSASPPPVETKSKQDVGKKSTQLNGDDSEMSSPEQPMMSRAPRAKKAPPKYAEAFEALAKRSKPAVPVKPKILVHKALKPRVVIPKLQPGKKMAETLRAKKAKIKAKRIKQQIVGGGLKAKDVNFPKLSPRKKKTPKRLLDYVGEEKFEKPKLIKIHKKSKSHKSEKKGEKKVRLPTNHPADEDLPKIFERPPGEHDYNFAASPTYYKTPGAATTPITIDSPPEGGIAVEQKIEIARYAGMYSKEEAATHFTDMLGFSITEKAAEYYLDKFYTLKKVYGRDPTPQEFEARRRSTPEEKDELVDYAEEHGNDVAAQVFSQKWKCYLNETSVRNFVRAHRKRKEEQNATQID